MYHIRTHNHLQKDTFVIHFPGFKHRVDPSPRKSPFKKEINEKFFILMPPSKKIHTA